jgi:hypothetical protein
VPTQRSIRLGIAVLVCAAVLTTVGMVWLWRTLGLIAAVPGWPLPRSWRIAPVMEPVALCGSVE